MEKSIILLVALLVSHLAPILSGATQYEIIDLGNLGGYLTRATGVNNAGQVVGYSITSSGEHHAFLWQNNTMTDLGTLPDHTDSFAQGINNSGHIVGSSRLTGANNSSRPFIYMDGVMQYAAFPDPYEGAEGTAYAINDYEQIIGSYGYYGGPSTGYPYLNDNGVPSSVLAPGNTLRYINNLGQVVGIGEESPNSGTCGFLYEISDRSITYLDSELGIGSDARGINDISQITGLYEVSDTDSHAYLYDNATVTDLGTLGGADSWGQAINNLSQIVGTSQTETGQCHAFLYEDGTMTDLGTLPGLANSYAYGINDNGWIVGYSNNKTIDTHAVLWKPIPEPPIPPVADAGSDQTVTDADDNGSEEVTLDGSGSSDTDGSIVSWVWTDNLGDTIPDGEVVLASLSVGIHTITLTVTDDDALTDTDTVTITVETFPNQPPIADADGPYSIYVADMLTLDASGSTDDDNDIVSYMWDLDDNGSFETDAGSQAIFDVNYTYLQLLGLLVNNTYNIHLKVTDSEGQSDTPDSTLTIIPKPATFVAVDIKPGSCPNPLNTKSSGVLPIAILGTEDVNVITIDPTSVRLIGVEPLRSGYEDVAGPVSDSNDCNCITDGPDGFLDLTLKFKTQRIVEAIRDVNDGDVLTLELTGVLFDPMPFETPIEGADCILIRGRHKPINPADINKDGVVDMADFAIFAQNWLQSSIVDE